MDKTKDNLRELSIDGCELLGRGAHAVVYKIAPDAIVKVYREDIPLQRIKTEKERARRALIMRVPTAISFDIVRVGNSYGAVYELIDADPTDHFINESRENRDKFIDMSVELLKLIHSKEVTTDDLSDMKADHYRWLENARELTGDHKADIIKSLIDEIPDSHKLLHGDFHMKNIIISKGKPMLIDMDTLCFGDPVFDLATITNSYLIFPKMDPAAATMHLGISVEDAKYIWERTLELYLDGKTSGELNVIKNKCKILGLIRILDFARRGGDPVHKDLMIEKSLSFLDEGLSELQEK